VPATRRKTVKLKTQITTKVISASTNTNNRQDMCSLALVEY